MNDLCEACGVAWGKHDGIMATCRKLQIAEIRIVRLESALRDIIDGAVNPETAIRRVMVDLAPIRKALQLDSKKPTNSSQNAG